MLSSDYALLPCRIDLIPEVAAIIRRLEIGAAPMQDKTGAAASYLPRDGKQAVMNSSWQAWSEMELRYFDREDAVSRKRYKALLDVFCANPGQNYAKSREEQAAAVGITTGELDSVYANISYWMPRECGGKEPPLHLIFGDAVDPSWPHESYRWMGKQDAANWRLIRGFET